MKLTRKIQLAAILAALNGLAALTYPPPGAAAAQACGDEYFCKITSNGFCPGNPLEISIMCQLYKATIASGCLVSGYVCSVSAGPCLLGEVAMHCSYYCAHPPCELY